MHRPWRIGFEGALYSILSRGNQGQDIFLTDADRHLLLKTHHANLSKAMQWFGTAYTRRFNVGNNCSGHLFQSRVKSFIIQNDAYLT